MTLSHAEQLLRSLGITSPKEIDLNAIALYCGATVKEKTLQGCEAQIIGHGDKAIININSAASSERKRFSIGHELGHWKYHRGKNFICRADDIGNNAYSPNDPERVADDYSSDLLMPAYLFKGMTNHAGQPNWDIIKSLAEEFQTSLTATALRYIKYSPIPTMLVCHAQNGRKWFRRGQDVPESLFPRSDLDADSYAMDVLYQRTVQPRPNLIGADAWFDKWDADRYEIHEQSIRVYDGLILTLLSWKDTAMLEKYAA